jgi:hypothetical protein
VEVVRLSSDLLYATLSLERRRRATLDDIERADALAALVVARRRRAGAAHRAVAGRD